MINVGSGTTGSSVANVLLGASRTADVNLDLAGRGQCPTVAQLSEGARTPHPCQGSAYHLPYPSGTFGAALCTHLLEHVEDPDAALAELHRVADRVYVVTPRWWWAHAWWGFDPSKPLTPQHKWLFAGGRRYRLW